ncbi:MAG: suppressor of fused domain protein [Planctomycetes bacterium]|nr:suppressor of fused domain protein [Planctomycetota bacterium]
MFNRIKQFFGGQKEPAAADDFAQQAEAWYERKSKLMEEILGREHGMVMHAIIPYAVGGGLDLYYYPHGVPGTAIATKELSELPGQGSSNRVFSCYELAMFTRHALDLDQAKDASTAFGRAHGTINSVLNMIARYSATASLNPNETCEFPAEMEHVGGKCLIFDAYGAPKSVPARAFGLLAVIEVHRSEMEFARAQGGAALLQRLKDAGCYPYSDLDREPVA